MPFVAVRCTSSESWASKFTAAPRSVGPGTGGVLSPDKGEEPCVLRPLADLAGLGDLCFAFAVRDMLSRGRAKNVSRYPWSYHITVAVPHVASWGLPLPTQDALRVIAAYPAQPKRKGGWRRRARGSANFSLSSLNLTRDKSEGTYHGGEGMTAVPMPCPGDR